MSPYSQPTNGPPRDPHPSEHCVPEESPNPTGPCSGAEGGDDSPPGGLVRSLGTGDRHSHSGWDGPSTG